MARILLLARHADIGIQYAGRFISQPDLALSDAGRRQCAGLAAVWRRQEPERCFCSPMRRTVETGELSGIQAEVSNDLREIDFGQCEGKTFQQISTEMPGFVAEWAEFREDFAFPGGESIRDFLTRVHRAADHLAADPADLVLAITHGGVIRTMICYLLGLSPRQYLLFRVDAASLTTIEVHEGKGVLARLNDLSHLEGI